MNDDTRLQSATLVERFIAEIWNVEDLNWDDHQVSVLLGDILDDGYRPGYWRTLHWGWRKPDRTTLDWLRLQIEPYRLEYPDFDIKIDRTIVDDDDVVTEVLFQGTHATRQWTDRGGNQRAATHGARGVGWSRIGAGGIARHAFFWEGGSFLGRDH